jgi:hypothetical protein
VRVRVRGPSVGGCLVVSDSHFHLRNSICAIPKPNVWSRAVFVQTSFRHQEPFLAGEKMEKRWSEELLWAVHLLFLSASAHDCVSGMAIIHCRLVQMHLLTFAHFALRSVFPGCFLLPSALRGPLGGQYHVHIPFGHWCFIHQTNDVLSIRKHRSFYV